MPIPETADQAQHDAQMGDNGIDDDELLSFDRCVASRAVMGCDMTECISKEMAARIAHDCGKVLSVDVMEMYLAERVAKLCADHGLTPGCSLDLANGYDFDTTTDRIKGMGHCESRSAVAPHLESSMHQFVHLERAQQVVEPEQSELDAKI